MIKWFLSGRFELKEQGRGRGEKEGIEKKKGRVEEKDAN